jgi:hypothetical protein
MFKGVQLDFPLARAPDKDSEGRYQNRPGVSESVNSSDEAAHHRVSTCNRSLYPRLDCFTFSLEVAIVRDADSGVGCFQKFA